MKKGVLISSRMKKEHGKMLVLLFNFMKGKKNSLAKLKDMQERHAFAEEKAIMIFYRRKKDFSVLSEILDQHKQMSDYLKLAESDFSVAKKLDKLMKTHIKLEDSKFYPMLDTDLMSEEQEKMFEEFVFLFNQEKKF